MATVNTEKKLRWGVRHAWRVLGPRSVTPNGYLPCRAPLTRPGGSSIKRCSTLGGVVPEPVSRRRARAYFNDCGLDDSAALSGECYRVCMLSFATEVEKRRAAGAYRWPWPHELARQHHSNLPLDGISPTLDC